MEPKFQAGTNIAIKIPKSKYEKTVAFYRNILKFEIEEKQIDHPTVSRTHEVKFGQNIMWLDCYKEVDNAEIFMIVSHEKLLNRSKYYEQFIRKLEKAIDKFR